MEVQTHRVPAHIKNTLLFHNTLMHQMQKKWIEKSYKEKHAFRRAMSTRLLRKYKLVSMVRKTVGISHKGFDKTTDNLRSWFTYQRTGNQKIVDNSRASAGKTETITRFKKRKQRGSSLTQCWICIRNWCWRCLIWSCPTHFSAGWNLFGVLPQTSITVRQVSAKCMTMPKWKQRGSSTLTLLTHRAWAKSQRSCAVTHRLKLACTGNVSHVKASHSHTHHKNIWNRSHMVVYQWLTKK